MGRITSGQQCLCRRSTATAEPPAPGREAVSLADLQWFALFQDERLQALISTALENNYDVRIAVARVLEAQAQLGVTRSFLLPTVDGTAAVARDRVSEERFMPLPSGVSPEGNTFALGLALTWEVDVWGRIRRETEAARAELLATEWARRAVLVTVISQVASAYFALRELDDELEIAQRTLASRQKSLRLTQLRLEQGVATRLDVRQAETLLYTAAATIPDAGTADCPNRKRHPPAAGTASRGHFARSYPDGATHPSRDSCRAASGVAGAAP